MRVPEDLKNKIKFKTKNEKGGVTLFVLIAMLFFLTVGLIIFITSMNNNASQQQDKKKIQSEYNSTINTANLDTTYNEEEAKVTDKIQIIVRDAEGNVYQEGNWTNKIPLTVQVIWPKEVKSNDTTHTQRQIVVMHGISVSTTYTESQIQNLNIVDDGTYNIFAQINDNKAQLTVKVDSTAPSVTISPNGDKTYINPTTRKLLDTIEITAEDSLSGVKSVEYIISKNEQTPTKDDENWKTYSEIDEIPNAQNGEIYYVYAKVTDNVGNVDILKSSPYEIVEARATFMPGTDINVKMKTLAGNTGTITKDTADELITKIQFNSNIPAEYKTDSYKVSTDTSKMPIYMWATDDAENEGKKIINWYSDDPHPYMNEDASYMFSNLRVMSQIANLANIDTSNTTNMSYLFRNSVALTTLDVSSFDTSNVTTMAYMFAGGYDNVNDASTNQLMGLTSIVGLNSNTFNTSKVTDMSYMFYLCTNISTLDLSKFDTSKVINMHAMFAGAYPTSGRIYTHFTTITGIETFNTSSVEDMASMFAYDNSITTLNLNNWDTSKVTAMYGMFEYNTKLTTLEISNWNTSNVTDMHWMFWNASKITTLDLRGWNTSKVRNMSRMFRTCSSLIIIYATDSFSIGAVTSSGDMFTGCSKLVGGSGTVYDSTKVDKTYARIDNKGTDEQGNILKGYFTNHYYIEFNANDGTQDPAKITQGIPFSYATDLKANTFTRQDYIFRGWNTKADGTGKNFTDLQSMNYDLAGIKAEVTDSNDKADDKNVVLRLYAVWSQVHYNVTYGTTEIITKPAETLAEAIGIAEEAIGVETDATDGTTITTATITATQDYTDNSTATVSENIVIDLAGHTITRGAAITNNGTLDIYSSADGGTITGSIDKIIINNGTFSTNGTSADHTMSLVNTTTVAKSRIITYDSSSSSVGNATINAKSTLEFTNPIQSGSEVRYILTNKGIITINGATLSTSSSGTTNEYGVALLGAGTNGRIIINNGTTITTTGYAIYNNGSTKKGATPAIEINGDSSTPATTTTITSRRNSINNNMNADVTINGGIINTTGNGFSCIANNTTGTVNVNGGSIDSSSGYGIGNGSTGIINVSGGSVSGNNGIYNNANGTINVSGENTTVTGKNGTGIRGYNGNVTVTSGTITGKSHGISIVNADNISGTATVGINDSSVSKISPIVTSTASSGDYYGVYRDENATFNFYDGIISGYDAHSLNAEETSKPSGYHVVKRTVDGKEIAVLEKEVIITADAMGGAISEITGWTGTGATATKTVLQNTPYGILPTQDKMTKTGYTFSAWYTAPTGGTVIDENTTVTSDTNHSIYAHWTANPYTIVFDKNDEAATGTMENESMTYDQEKALTTNGFSKTGYTFVGWATSPSGNVVYTDGQSVSNLATSGEVTLYAKWEDRTGPTITVTSTAASPVDYLTTAANFNAASGKSSANITAIVSATDDGSGMDGGKIEYVLDNNTENPTTGWTETISGTTLTFSSKAFGTYYLHVKATDKDGNESYATTQELNVRYVIWYRDYITNTSNTQTVYVTPPTATVTTRIPNTKTGYTFEGWYTKNNGGTRVAGADENYTATKSIILYAHWSKGINDLTVTLTESTYTYDGEPKTPAIEVKDGDTVLTQGTDYEVVYTNNTNAGTATATVTMKNAYNSTKRAYYTGSVDKQFTINKAANIVAVEGKTGLTYNTTAQELVTTTSAQGPVYYSTTTELTASNYTNSSIASTDVPTNVDVGTYTVYWYTPGNENYGDKSGNTSATIAQFDISSGTIANIENQNYTGSAITPEPAVTVTINGASKELTETSEFTYSYSNNNNPGDTATVTATGTENYTGSVSKTFTINPKVTFNNNNGIGTMSDEHVTYNINTALTANTFTKVGYYFKEWNTAANGSGTSYANQANVKLTANTTLFAIWEANQYSIKFDKNDNLATGTMANQEFTYDQAQNLTANGFNKIGYSFAGWATTSSGAVVYTDEQSVSNLTEENNVEVTLFAKWTANSYSVTLNAGDYGTINELAGWIRAQDNKTATKDIIYDGAYGTFPTASRVGYDFDGWFTEATGGTEVKADTIMQTAGSVTLYPHWTARTDTPYVVNHYTHDLGAATYTLNSTDNLQGTSDATITINDLKKTIAGHTFEAGYLTGDTTKPSSGEVTTTTVAADGTRVINMYYRPNYLYVQYHMNGGSMTNPAGGYGNNGDLLTYTGNTTSTNFLHGIYGGNVGVVKTSTYEVENTGLQDYTINNKYSIEKTGYRPISKKVWNTLADGTGTAYSMATSTYNAEDMATACGKDLSTGDQVVTLYVNWEPTPYTITYNLDGGTNHESNPVTYTVESADITLQDPTKTGYTFNGWTGNGTTIPTKNLVLSHGSIENKTYTANWTANLYTIAYNGNGSTSGSTASQNATYDQDITLNANGFNRTYTVHYTANGGDAIADATATYTFKGWELENAGDLIENQATVRNLATTGAATLYAQWNSGSVTLPEATRVGYTFAGWFTNTDLTQSAGTVGEIFTPTAETTLYAKWTANQYTVTADANGGTIGTATGWNKASGNLTATKSVTYDSTYGTLPSVERTGYTLKGWNGKNLFNVETAVNDYYIKKSNGQPIAYSSSSTPWSCSDYIEIEGGKTYTFNPNSTAGSSSTAHALYDANKTFISAVGTGKQTIATPSNAKYIRVSYRRSNSSNMQLEEGSAATSYESYYITSDTTVKTAKAHTIKAIWEANKYNVVFNKNADSATGTMANEEFSYDEEKALTANGFSRTGYTFTGWNTSANGAGDSYTNSQAVSNLVTSGNITLYAQWTPNTFTIVYNSNTGTGTMANQTVTYDTDAYLTENTFTKSDNIFTGWNTEANGSGTSYANRASIKNLLTSGSITLYAQWVESKFNVTNPVMYLNLSSNKEGQINVTKSEQCVISFTSDDSSIATVNSTGKVTAVKAGTVTIKVTDTNTGVTQNVIIYVDTILPIWKITNISIQ